MRPLGQIAIVRHGARPADLVEQARAARALDRQRRLSDARSTRFGTAAAPPARTHEEAGTLARYAGGAR